MGKSREGTLMDEKVKELREYNLKEHILPDGIKTVIEKIEVVNRFEQ
jgi:hypothetical protein